MAGLWFRGGWFIFTVWVLAILQKAKVTEASSSSSTNSRNGVEVKKSRTPVRCSAESLPCTRAIRSFLLYTSQHSQHRALDDEPSRSRAPCMLMHAGAELAALRLASDRYRVHLSFAEVLAIRVDWTAVMLLPGLQSTQRQQSRGQLTLGQRQACHSSAASLFKTDSDVADVSAFSSTALEATHATDRSRLRSSRRMQQ